MGSSNMIHRLFLCYQRQLQCSLYGWRRQFLVQVLFHLQFVFSFLINLINSFNFSDELV